MVEDRSLLISGGTVVPMTGRACFAGDVLVTGNRIVEVGPTVTTPLAGTLHNLKHGAGAVDAWTVLELATWRGAQVRGLDAQFGRPAPGFLDDITSLGCESPAAERLADPADVIVFGLGTESVRHVLVDGVVVVADGQLSTDDATRIRAEARRAGAAIAGRLGWS